MMKIPKFRVFIDGSMYNVVSLSESIITLSRPFESKFIESINIKTTDGDFMLGSDFRDIKGCEIFEGDIVKNADKVLGVVKFEDGSFIVEFKQVIREVLSLIYDEVEVVGNKYEDVKLLEKALSVNFKKTVSIKNKKGVHKKGKNVLKDVR